MIDPAVERQYSDTKELLALWRTFYDFFVMGVKNDNITPEKEGQFLEIKSRIAMLHDSFMEALTHNQNIGQEVLNIISRAITLRHLGKQSTADIKKMEIEWHESYLLLNETIGVLEEKRNELALINERQYRAGKVAGAAKQKVNNFLTSPMFKIAVIIAGVLFATFGVQTLGIYDYNELGKIPALKTPYNWGKALVRKFGNPESPWVSIDSWNRTPHSEWPSGVQPPELQSASSDEFIRQVPLASIRPLLNDAKEYRKEVSQKRNSAPVEIHTFFFEDSSKAKEIVDKWRAADKASQQRLSERIDFWRSYNIVSAVKHTDAATVNAMRVDVFKSPDR